MKIWQAYCMGLLLCACTEQTVIADEKMPAASTEKIAKRQSNLPKIYFAYLAQYPNPNYVSLTWLDWQKMMNIIPNPRPHSRDEKLFHVKLPPAPLSQECVLVEESPDTELIFPLEMIRAYEQLDRQEHQHFAPKFEHLGSYQFLKKLKPLKNHHLGCNYVYKNTSQYRRPDSGFIAMWVKGGNIAVWDKSAKRFVKNITIIYMDMGSFGGVNYYADDNLLLKKTIFYDPNGRFFSTDWYIS